jgi:hypothetical protein
MTGRNRSARTTQPPPENRPWLSSMIRDFSSTARWAHDHVGAARDTPKEEVMREEIVEEIDEQPEERRPFRTFRNTVLLLLVLGQAAAVVYLLSERNARRYFLVADGRALTVMRGRFQPTGETLYQPEGKTAALYAPLPMPSFAEFHEKAVFEERGDLDTAIVDTCLEWAAKLAAQGTAAAANQTVYLLGRAAQFRTIAPEQQKRRLELERSVAFQIARGHLGEGLGAFQAAVEQLEQSTKSKEPIARRGQVVLNTVQNEVIRIQSMLQWIDGLDPAANPEPAQELTLAARTTRGTATSTISVR